MSNGESLDPLALTWRQNFERLKEEIAASPLPTRQLKRMAARALAKELTRRQKIEGRSAAIIARRTRNRRNADLRRSIEPTTGDEIALVQLVSETGQNVAGECV